MWLQTLKELKKQTGMSVKQIAAKSNLPERTVARVFDGSTEHPRIDTLYLIVTAMGGSMNDIFADTTAIIATEKLVEIKETADVVEAERDMIVAENAILKEKVNALTAEIDLLKLKLLHKEELLALHNYYNKISATNN